MLGRDILKTLSILFLIIIGGGFFNITMALAQSERRLNIDIDKSDSIKLQSTIMEIDVSRGILIVAEKEIHIVDLLIEGHQFKTVLHNVKGKPVLFESFHVGKRVYVEGLELEGDRVAASMIQHVPSPKAKAGRKHRNSKVK